MPKEKEKQDSALISDMKSKVKRWLTLDDSAVNAMPENLLKITYHALNAERISQAFTDSEKDSMHGQMSISATKVINKFSEPAKVQKIENLIDTYLDRFVKETQLSATKSFSSSIQLENLSTIKLGISVNRLTVENDPFLEILAKVKKENADIKKDLENLVNGSEYAELYSALNIASGIKTGYSQGIFTKDHKIEREVYDSVTDKMVKYEFQVQLGITKPKIEADDSELDDSEKVVKTRKAVKAEILETEKELENQPKISLAQLADLTTEKALQDHSKTIQK